MTGLTQRFPAFSAFLAAVKASVLLARLSRGISGPGSFVKLTSDNFFSAAMHRDLSFGAMLTAFSEFLVEVELHVLKLVDEMLAVEVFPCL